MIEELDDVIESIADEVGRYGCHVDESNDACKCRVCFTSNLRARILNAAEIEAIINTKKEATR
jgi:hypothetical protein